MEKHTARITRYWCIIIVLAIITPLLSVICLFPSVCDWYTEHIYIHIANIVGRFYGLFPFAIGELMMYLGILLLILGIAFLTLLIFLRKKQKYRNFCVKYFKALLMIGLGVIFTYVITWLIPICGTVLGKDNTSKRTDFTPQEVTALYVYIINGINDAADEIEITDDNKIQFYDDDALLPKISDAMRNVSDEFPRLSGYYPPVKTAFCSDILDIMGIGGYTYPFTMEVTRNKYVSPAELPCLISHEFSHHKGFYKENEANFISQIALSESCDPILRFSGYENMRYYAEKEYYNAMDLWWKQMEQQGIAKPLPELHQNMTDEEKKQLKNAISERNQIFYQYFGTVPEISERAEKIKNISNNICLEEYQADSHPINDMPAVNQVIDEASDFGWEAQADILQENNYNGVFLLLMQYFDGILY